MSLEIVARKFVGERGISIKENKNRFTGNKDQLSVIFFGAHSDRLLLQRKFPALHKRNESHIYVSEGSQLLKFSILYGCLHDYVVALEGAKSQFCQDIRDVLIYHHLKHEREKPEIALVQEVTPFTYAGVAELLDSFYPIV